MELKTYQRKVIADLSRYMELLNQTGNMDKAYCAFWEEKGVPVGFGGVKPYENILPGVPNLCLKVPTGGGKTFLACNAIKPIFDGLPEMKMKAVVWLVPSDAILSQTIAALRNPDHPYRQKINTDFGGRVEVYDKEQLLNGQNFNITAVQEQLSIMVLSYDTFRGRKEQLKAKQENSNLAPMAKALGTPAYPVEDADETALLQVINQLSPLVIVDESHHARSKLSKEMLQNFNPCFVLDLTATPTRESNILCYVDAVQLKRENMVKLPVIVYNRDSQQEVMADAIDLRSHLEQYAQEAQKKTGEYIRPIVLFQAQPKGKEDSTTFEKLREKLVSAGIPAEEIAIKTADVNELKGVDLLSPACPVRYIITVNALKEGWDCPFAYILASLANKTSQVDVEQIVGRVLRQPYARRHEQAALNMSYVLTSSNDFKTTLDGIVKGLNGAGFSDQDYRVGDVPDVPAPQPVYQQEALTEPTPDTGENSENEDFLNFDSDSLRRDMEARTEAPIAAVDAMLQNAEKEQAAFERALTAGADYAFEDIPTEVRAHMSGYRMNVEFAEEASTIRIPQFFLRVEQSLFTQGGFVLLTKTQLAKGFTLKGKPYGIDFDRADDEIAKVDINDTNGGTPKVFKMTDTDQRYFKEQFSKYGSEQKIRICKDIIHKQINKMDMIHPAELRTYIDRIVDDMDKDTLSALEKSPQGFALRIRKYIENLLEEHYEKTFNKWVETGTIVCQPSYALPDMIAPLRPNSTYGLSLYQAEEDANGFERDMVLALTGLENIKWWHRNMSRKGFVVNGFINHYPDFIVMTKTGKIVLIETKGDHLDNEQNRKKLDLSRTWQSMAGGQFKYYMVFQDKAPDLKGAYSFDGFMEILQEL